MEMMGPLSKQMVSGLALKRKDYPRKSWRPRFEGRDELFLAMG